MFQQINEGFVIKIKVIPKSSRSEIVGWEGDELKIRLAAIPEKGEANIELIAFLAALFHVAKSQVKLIRGATSRHKQIVVSNFEFKEAVDIMHAAIAKKKLK